jgi:hypothetical protein
MLHHRKLFRLYMRSIIDIYQICTHCCSCWYALWLNRPLKLNGHGWIFYEWQRHVGCLISMRYIHECTYPLILCMWKISGTNILGQKQSHYKVWSKLNFDMTHLSSSLHALFLDAIWQRSEARQMLSWRHRKSDSKPLEYRFIHVFWSWTLLAPRCTTHLRFKSS